MRKPMVTDEKLEELIQSALNIRHQAYAPYSNYAVGAALLAKSGRIFLGVNVENAAYSTTMCAERVAVFKAVSEGEQEFDAIAVVTDNGGSPCGSCRQVLSEFGLETMVILVDGKGHVVEKTTVAGLLPAAFSPNDLIIKE